MALNNCSPKTIAFVSMWCSTYKAAEAPASAHPNYIMFCSAHSDIAGKVSRVLIESY